MGQRTLKREAGGVLIPLSLSRCRNGRGRLERSIRQRLIAVVNRPCDETWNAAYSIVISERRGRMTLWQAVVYVDPKFPRTGPAPATDMKWSRIPTRDVLLMAIESASK